METRASYIVVGAFVLGLVAAAVAITVWIAKVQIHEAPARYVIHFTGDVTGLNVGSPVRYRGVPVGTVTDIRIDPANVERTRVVVDIGAATPVKEDVVAEIALQGITGIAFIQLTGGSQDAPTLKPRAEPPLPEIRSRPSPLQEILSRLPQILERMAVLGDRLTRLLDDRNLTAVSQTLENLRRVSEALGAEKGDMRLLLREGREALATLRGLAEDSRALAAGIRSRIGPLDDQATKTMADLRKVAASLAAAADQIGSMVEENRGPLRHFSQTGLYELGQFAAEARVLVDALIRLSQQIERDPARFFFGDVQKGYRAQ